MADKDGFTPCLFCWTHPGRLCPSCERNRRTILALQEKLRAAEPPHDNFEECPECSKKPGLPTLCKSCVHNRRLIEELRLKVREAEGKLRALQEYDAELAEKIAGWMNKRGAG